MTKVWHKEKKRKPEERSQPETERIRQSRKECKRRKLRRNKHHDRTQRDLFLSWGTQNGKQLGPPLLYEREKEERKGKGEGDQGIK